MKIKEIHIEHYKRFTNLTIKNIPATAKLVVLVGPNGCGKTSLFEAFNYWYRLHGWGNVGDKIYAIKKEDGVNFDVDNWFDRVTRINLQFADSIMNAREVVKGKFYFRSAYRNEADFTISQFKQQGDPKGITKNDLMTTDQTVSSNFQRLVSSVISGVFEGSNDEKHVSELREEIIGKIRESLNRVFNDLNLTGVGNDPLSKGSFYFQKGTVKDFHYKNLSAGEKSAFDLILDLIVKSNSFPNAIYCIDEPEAHMHTHLQSVLLEEIYGLIPDKSQLWVSTHSLGMLRRAQQLERDNPGTVFFLDFDGIDFDSEVVITPTIINRTILSRFMQLALDDLSDFMAPHHIVFCEGNPKGHANPNFDAHVYTRIFAQAYIDVAFVSAGSCSEVENKDNTIVNVVVGILQNSNIIKVVDRDDLCNEEVVELMKKGVKVLSRRHIECYLLDDEIIAKLCNSLGKQELITECLKAKSDEIKNSIDRGNPLDDVKSASGPIIVRLKRILSLTRCGNTRESFLMNTIVPLITPDTNTYHELKKSIFG